MMKLSSRFARSYMLIHMTLSLPAGAQPPVDMGDLEDLKRDGGGARGHEVNNMRTTSFARREEELKKELKQTDMGMVPSEAAQDGGSPASSFVNKHLPQSNTTQFYKNYFGFSLKNIQNLLNKYLIRLPNWWKQMSDLTSPQNNQTNKS